MKVLYLYTAILKFFIFICFCINKLKAFEEWSSESRYISWSILLFTCIFLSWISYPKLLNQLVVQKDSLVEFNSDKRRADLEQNLVVNSNNSINDSEENFSYKKLGEKYGTLGDTYGALNTLFTGLAFGGLIVSIFLQMLELRATRKELAEQKDALLGQKEEFEAQTNILNKQIDLIEKQKIIAEGQSSINHNQLIESRKQNFTSLFNALLEERRFKIKNFKIYGTPSINSIEGFDVITEYGVNFLSRLREVNCQMSLLDALKKFGIEGVHKEEDVRKAFSKDWNFFESQSNRNYVIGNYFTIIFTLFNLIEEHQEVLGTSYIFYIETVKRIIHQHELIVLFWISLGFPEMDEKIYKYKLFERLSYTDGIGVIGKNIFRLDAFGSSIIWEECFNSINV